MRTVSGVAISLALVAAPQAQEVPLLDLLVERLGEYLLAYENQIALLVADERYEQNESQRTAMGPRQQQRTLQSQVTFLRLSGDGEWFGIRDVRRVDGRPVVGARETLIDVLRNPRNDLAGRVAAIIEASSKHYLGSRQAINMPTVPLEALSADNHPRYIFKIAGKDRIAGVETQRLDFHEFDEPTLVQAADGGSLWTRGSAWIEVESGRLWRAEVVVGPDRPNAYRRVEYEARVRVDFTYDDALKLLVPKELVESYWLPRGRGTGRARYDNFRFVAQR